MSVLSQVEGRVTFAPVSLEGLIDWPVLAGEFFRAVPLTSKWPAELDVTGDSQPVVDGANDANAFTLFGRLLDQDQAMFGFRHWLNNAHFCVAERRASLRLTGA